MGGGTGTRRWFGARASLVVALVALASCSVDGSDPAADAPGSSSGSPETSTSTSTSTTEPDRPPGTVPAEWVLVTLCSSVGPVQVEMPGPVELDGPQSLAILRAPAEGSFAMSHSPDDTLRYDALVIDRISQVSSEDEHRLELVITQIDGDPAGVVVTSAEAVDQHLEATFRGAESGRDLRGIGFGGSDVVFVIDIGTYPGAAPAVLEAGRDDLDRMRRSIDFPGLDDGVPRSCEASGSRPLRPTGSDDG